MWPRGAPGWLTDFGIARQLAAARAAPGTPEPGAGETFYGTLEYMAPELSRGRAADQRADIYSLGVVLYEMLTNHVAFQAPMPEAVAALVLAGNAPLPSRLNPAVTPEVEAAVRRVMAVDPGARFPKMLSLVVAIRRAVSRRPDPDVRDVDVAPMATLRPALGGAEAEDLAARLLAHLERPRPPGDR